MSQNHPGNAVPEITREEHDGILNAKKVSVVSAATVYAVTGSGAAWSDPKTYIGLVTATGDFSTSFSGNVTLDPGSKTGIVGNLTLSDPKSFIGLVTAVGDFNTSFTGNVTLDPGSKTQIVGNLTLSDPKSFIGLVTAVGEFDTTFTGNVTLDPGSKTGIVGNLTIDSLPAWTDPKDFIGLVTVTGDLGATFSGNMTLDPGSRTGIVGNITIDSGVVTLGANDGVDIGDVDVASNTAWTDPSSFIGLVSVANPLPVDATGQGDVPITLDGETVDISDRAARDLGTVDISAALPAGDNNIGNVDVASNTAWANPNTYIGLVTVDIGAENGVSFAGNVTLDPGSKTGVVGNLTIDSQPAWSDPATYIGLVSVSGFANPLPVDATGQGDVPVTLDGEAVDISDRAARDLGTVDISAALPAGDNNIGNIDIASAIPAGANYIGLVTIANASIPVTFSGNVTLDDGSKTGIVGNLTLSDPKGFIGLVSVSGFANPLPVTWSGNVTLDDGSLVGIIGNVTLSDSKGFIGLTTTVQAPPPIATYTSFCTIFSATGNHSLFAPPAGKRFVIKDLHVASLGRSELEIKSGDKQLIPYTSLATTGGFFEHFGPEGLAAEAADDIFALTLNGAATISIMANVRFE